jgi:16S rRNA (cytosine1402-N4)-methyltransferase
MLAAAENLSDVPNRIHQPVMSVEVRDLLCERRPLRIIDATVGTGGHAAVLLQNSPSASCLLGLDRDPHALETAQARLIQFGARARLSNADFADLDVEARKAGFDQVDAILADLGMSTFALDDPNRGFSFRYDGPLDMRMDPSEPVRAYDLVNETGERELAHIIYEYGEERASRRIARAIVSARSRAPIATTGELRTLLERVLGPHRGGVHPATRTFQALRISVNHELQSLQRFLEKAPGLLAKGGRICVLAYHSLEDRPAKERFRELGREPDFTLLTRKAMRPSPAETADNPRSRSARLRSLERNL